MSTCVQIIKVVFGKVYHLHNNIKWGVEKELKKLCNKGFFFSISHVPMNDIFDCAQKKNIKYKNKEKQKAKKKKMLLHDCKRVF